MANRQEDMRGANPLDAQTNITQQQLPEVKTKGQPLVSPQEFYQSLTKRADIRELLRRLAKQ